ncbi:hypothetical protein BRARA_A02360 [Brassica rapa]|uniref:Uncharacterized protein n=1 Tax=Brassica campestris TaxID=3711 RepID=A0A398APM1_BRACM|nr:hypothetical protein BRARA_A02360 [Brassica rapa]
MKLRLPNILSGLQGKSQIVQDELSRLGEQLVSSAEGTRAIALELCREFEDKFLLHLAGGEGSGWKVVASFEGNFPNRIKQLPLDRYFDLNNVKRIVLEADGYQPYLISPEKGIHDNRAAAASSWSDSGTESSPKTNGGSTGEDWMNAFNAAASGQDSLKRYGSGGHSRRYSDPAQNGEDDSSGSGGSNRRTTPNRLPPAPPQSGGSSYRY